MEFTYFLSNVWGIIFSLLLAYLSAKIFKEYMKYLSMRDDINKLPGLPTLPIIGNLHYLMRRKEVTAKFVVSFLNSFAEQNVSMIRIWVGWVAFIIIATPNAAKKVLESNTMLAKGDQYDILVPWLGTGLLISQGEKWHSRRKLLTPSFHFNVLQEFQPIFDYQSKILVEQLEKFANDGKEHDIYMYIKRCALDIICETAMGTSVSAQTSTSHPYVQAVEDINEMAFFYQKTFWWWFTATWYLSGAGFKYNRNIKILKGFTQKVINERIAEYERLGGWPEGRKRRPFLEMLIEVRKERGLSYEDIREEVDTFMFEGHDTTSSGIGWTLWLLAHEKECQQKVIDEQREIFGDSNRVCTIEDLKKMRYLGKCIKESMRMRSPVPQFTRRVDEDIEIEGYTLPKGCTIVIAPRFIHNNKNVFENPNQFDPERFNEDRIAGRDPYAYIPFSAGPRNCIGQKFAIQEEKTILSWIFRHYRFSASIPRDDNFPLPEIITRPWKGFPLKIEKL